MSGGVNGGDAALPVLPTESPVSFKPETLTAYEIGTKNRFLNNRLQLNGDFYYYDFHNYQITQPAFLNTPGQQASGDQVLVIENAGPVTTYGLELSGVFALTPTDRFTGSFTFAKGHFGSLNFVSTVPTPQGIFPLIVSIPSGGDLINLPEFLGQMGYEHDFDFANGSSLVFDVNTKISSSYLTVIGSQNNPFDIQKSYTMTNLALAYHFPADRYIVRGFVNNVENSAVNVYGQSTGINLYGILPPREAGVTATVNF